MTDWLPGLSIPSDKWFRKNCLQNIFKNEQQLFLQDILLLLILKDWCSILWLHWYFWSNFHWLQWCKVLEPKWTPRAHYRRCLLTFLDHPCDLGVLIRVTPGSCWLSQPSGSVSCISGTHHPVQWEIMPVTQHMVPALLCSPFVSVFAREIRMKMFMADYSKWLAHWKTLENPWQCVVYIQITCLKFHSLSTHHSERCDLKNKNPTKQLPWWFSNIRKVKISWSVITDDKSKLSVSSTLSFLISSRWPVNFYLL